MKYIKMLGLAAIASIAAMAFLGAGSASAAVLCLTNTSPCTEVKEVVNTLSGKGEGIFKSGLVNVECHALATVVDKPHGGEGLWLPITITFTFKECSGCSSVTATVKGAELMATGGGNGVAKGSGEATFKGCPFGVECKYAGEGVETLIDGSSTNALALVVGQKLKKSGGSAFCSSEGTWDATFHGETSTDKMTFVEPE